MPTPSEPTAEAGSASPPGDVMRLDWGGTAFLIVMLGASALTMVRMAAVAGLLAPADFARYATVIATGAYLATIISFGAVEQTVKAFPRMVEDGHENQLRRRSNAIFALLAKRASVVGIPALLFGSIWDQDWILDLGLASGYALVTASMALVASLQRALKNARRLAIGTVMRSAVVFACVVSAAYLAGLEMVLAAEIVATGIVCVLSVYLFVPPVEAVTDADRPSPRASGDRSGLAVFLAYGAVNVPFYLDRLYVNLVMGPEVAGRYAVLALFLMFAALLVGILAQRVGPDVIRLVHRDKEASGAGRHLALWVALASLAWLVTIATAAIVLSWSGLPSGIAQYAIEPRLLLPVAVSGVLLNVGLLEFLVIALDRETALLRAALGFLAITLVAAIAIALSRAELATFLWALAACRLVYAGMLVAALRSSPPGNMGDPGGERRAPLGKISIWKAQ